MYTAGALEQMCRDAGVDMAPSASDADALWVSMCDPDDLPALIAARKAAAGRPVIMGGFEAFFGEPYLAWADHVVVGEGWDFIEAWGRDPREALSLPCVLTRERSATANYHVAYEHMPLVRVPGGARGRYYYLAGRGCHNKCRFCATAWCMPHTSNPRAAWALSTVAGRGGKLTLISNDSGEIEPSPALNVQSVTVRDYLRAPERYKANMLHFGIEGWTEAARKGLGKPIADAALRDLFVATREARQRCELFFISDYPGWRPDDVQAFVDAVVPLELGGPAIHVKATYFDPCPHTPLAKEAVRGQWWSQSAAFAELNGRNKRIRVFPTRSRARSAWRTCLHRATPDEALRLGPQPSDTNTENSFGAFLARLERDGLAHLLAEQANDPCGRVSVRYK